MKNIILKYIDINSADVLVEIAEQSHRNENFGENGHDWYMAYNGFLLYSICYPEWGDTNTALLLRGDMTKRDNKSIWYPKQYLSLVNDAVWDYNNHFGYKGQSIIEKCSNIIPLEMFTL